jgi:CheY-like chemotaxis protein/DNA-directed RNA polymerase specialized sigma24 family protein
MSQISQQVVGHLPYLRRYARALTGSQAKGDQYVRACLETVVAEPRRLAADENLRLALFKLFHDVWSIVDKAIPEDKLTGTEPDLTGGLHALPSRERQALLLTSLEGFTHAEAARILRMDEKELDEHLARARDDIMRLQATRVLIIEDDPLIAMDIAQIVREMGHTVCGTAARKEEALAVARKTEPGLVLADIQLKDGDTGVETVEELLKSVKVPVVFVTGYPEKLLTGERTEPTFLVTKPFNPETLRAAIGQALSF